MCVHTCSSYNITANIFREYREKNYYRTVINIIRVHTVLILTGDGLK